MKAAILHRPGTPLEIAELPSPVLHPSSVRVRVLATHVLSFTNVVVGGQFPFPLPTPYTPGLSAIGIVEEAADDVYGLRRGQKVFCSPLVAERRAFGAPERMLKGWIGMTPNCGPLLDRWKEGAFAEQSVYPVENVTPLDDLDDFADEQLACMYYLCIAYGAFLRAEWKPGQSVLVTGASGNLGAAAVLVALAMGASHVYAAGRNGAALASLAALDPKRVAVAALPSAPEDYAAFLAETVPGVDALIDAVGIVDDPRLLEAGMARLQPKGTAVLLGGVVAPVPVNYMAAIVGELNIKGSSMYPTGAPEEITRMIRSGTLNLGAFRPRTFPLARINEAVGFASGCRGLDYCVLKP